MSRAACLLLSLLWILPLSSRLAAQQRDPKLDALAGGLAQKLEKEEAQEGRLGAPFFCLIFDFIDSGGQRTQLGAHLADDFSAALSNRLPGLTTIDRSKLDELFSRDGLQPAEMRSDSAISWAARTLGANLAIVGTIEPRGEQFNLHLRVINERSKEILHAGAYLDWTNKRRDSANQPYVNPIVVQADPLAQIVASHPGSKGVGDPVCIRCPKPNYTEEARLAGFKGTIIIQVVVGPDGRVQEAIPIRGSPYGLTEQALATVRIWQFQPMFDSSGKSVSVEFPVEVKFRAPGKK